MAALGWLLNLDFAGGGAAVAPSGIHARTGESGTAGTWSDPAIGFWGNWHRVQVVLSHPHGF